MKHTKLTVALALVASAGMANAKIKALIVDGLSHQGRPVQP